MQFLANPNRFLKIANAVLPTVWVITVALFAIGLHGALVTAPADYQQGETARIMYVHVPAAWMALFVYTAVALASAVAAIFRHPLADVAAKTAAPIGAVFCFLSLATGSLWGKPMWGAWWVWDARLTSMFVLMLLYIGYMAVWAAIEEPHRAAMVARVVALVGFINVPIVKFSVDWWNSLHQPASVFRMDGPTIAWPMLWPLLVMGLAYSFLFLGLQLTAMRAEIAARKIRQIQIAEIGER
ncbi:heme ABC transporter permease [Aestuariivirga sp.]|uniref:heme ABC transporter permease n=1 Tax=Aestuariivirga sp. TaxID=2650926 RepID=UPI0025C23B68|nr:heme ABC transporter permease [Aestuariivirga sp.]MCA3555916.1 heme ABC transporter permease [Aestuariivirga sp.]